MKETLKHIIIIGGGPAGIEAAEHLSELGYQISIIEKVRESEVSLTIGISYFLIIVRPVKCWSIY
jgi:heterodisulfide reductase subunit A-like polyferredoxin